jgi:glutathione synthase/RimK-type ligase-like ATP-grasp enzyme
LILIISFPGDPHAERVLGHLRTAGQAVELLDLADLPTRATITLDYSSATAPRLHLGRGANGTGLDLDGTSAVWWRRPQTADVSSITDHDVQLFTAGEWHEAISGLWQLLDRARWMNDPVRDDVASRKALQLRLAAEAGLRIPRTLMTSDPERARAFIDREGLGHTIFKTFSCTHAVWRETRLLREEDLEKLDAVRLAPVIFQEYVPADVDLRVTVVGERVFAAAIHSQTTDYPVDFRMSLGQAACAAADLPPEVDERIRRLMDRLGLVYGAIDMRRTPTGEHVFLEVNTAGEFLFVEERTGQPISQAIAAWLAGARIS